MYHFTISVGKMRGVLVYKDRVYQANGPKRFRQLSPYLQEVNAICRTPGYSEAEEIVDALNRSKGTGEPNA